MAHSGSTWLKSAENKDLMWCDFTSFSKQVSANMISISGRCMCFVLKIYQTIAGNSVWSVNFTIFFYIISGGFFPLGQLCGGGGSGAACMYICLSARVTRQWVQSHQSAETGLFVKAEAFWPGNAAFVVMASGLCASEPFRCKVIHWSIAGPQPLLLHTIQCGEIISEGTFWYGTLSETQYDWRKIEPVTMKANFINFDV